MRRISDTLRAGAAAVGVAAGLMVLASTAQTPDGFIHASFGGKLDLFGSTSSDVLAIGDGSNDVAELGALLKGQVNNGDTYSPYRVTHEAGSAPDTTALNVFPTAAPTTKDAAILPSKPVVDSHGRVDCTGAVSCHTDPVTKVTTVTYPDGVVAVVQFVNNLTVVAYKTVVGILPSQVQTLLPAPPQLPTLPAATLSPAPTPEVAPTPELAAPAPDATAGPVDPGPPAPDPDLSASERQGPRVNVTRPPMDFSPGHDGGSTPEHGGMPSTNDAPLGKVKDALGSVVDAVKGAVGKALGPGASEKGSTTGTSGSDSRSGSDSP